MANPNFFKEVVLKNPIGEGCSPTPVPNPVCDFATAQNVHDSLHYVNHDPLVPPPFLKLMF